MRHRHLVSLSAAAFALGACSAAVADPVCTLIGCISGLFVSFSTTPAGPFHVEVTSPTSPTPKVYDCANPAQCFPVVQFRDFMPDTAFVTVTYAGRTTTTEVHPVYEAKYPNGKACGGACSNATVTLALP